MEDNYNETSSLGVFGDMLVLPESLIPEKKQLKDIYGKKYGGNEVFELDKLSKENAELQLPKGNFSKGFGEITH